MELLSNPVGLDLAGLLLPQALWPPSRSLSLLLAVCPEAPSSQTHSRLSAGHTGNDPSTPGTAKERDVKVWYNRF